MKCERNALVLFALFFNFVSLFAQSPPVRRAQPVESPPVPRALPAEDLPSETRSTSTPNESSEADSAPPSKRQLEYAEGLFAQKQYDLAIPEFEKYVDRYPTGAERARVHFFLGEAYRALNKPGPARKNFQVVLDDFGESDYAGPAAYVLAETAFTEKNYGGALPLFHRAAAKANEPRVALSARYFEARCLEALDKKDEAAGIYLQVIEAKDPNSYRDDSRQAAAAFFLSRGKKLDAFKQYDALANDAQKAPLKLEAAVRAGVIGVDLVQNERGKIDKTIIDRTAALLQRGRTAADAGKFRAIAQVAMFKLQYYTGQYAQLLGDYKKEQQKLPDDARAEVMLLAANSERQLNHAREAAALYDEIIAKFPSREEAKDAAYQKLINIYNSDFTKAVAAVDEYLQTNPTTERADQAKMLKAEALYKQQNYTDAAALYAELRVGQLSPKLRAEAAFKLGSCHLQLKNTEGVIEAYTYYVQAFPDNPQTPSAYAKRALAYEETQNYEAALMDLNVVLSRYPQAREREGVLQQKALILGQQGNAKAMTDSFRQLLKEFPKSSVAAQAHFYIGKTALENKEFKAAIAELNSARQINKEQYYNPATVRIISSYFALKDRAAVTKEVDAFMAAKPNAPVPADILDWLGIQFYNEKNYSTAEKYLSALAKIDNPQVKPDFLFYLGDAAAKLQKFDEAENAYAKYLQTANDPAGKAKVLLALGSVKIAAHKPDDAQKIAEQIMQLQPEGRVNAEARLLLGDVQVERNNFDEAGKAFMGVALLYDDAAITPRALQKASNAYQRAGKTDEAAHAAKQLHDKYPNFAGS
jgi:TolA-binding protein